MSYQEACTIHVKPKGGEEQRVDDLRRNKQDNTISFYILGRVPEIGESLETIVRHYTYKGKNSSTVREPVIVSLVQGNRITCTLR